MTNGIFKRLGRLAYALAADVMSTQSATGFEWSVKLVGAGFRVGIVSQLKTGESFNFHRKDKNAILYNLTYNSSSKTITNGSNIIYSNLPKHKDEDVIPFRFQPYAKKLIINLKVRVLKLHINLK